MARNTAEVAKALLMAENIALVCHVSPDGDTIGTALALKLGLEQLGKRVTVFAQDKVPDILRMLKGVQEVRMPETLRDDEHFDLLMPVDVAEKIRVGRCEVLFDRCDRTAQLDHHGTNPLYCDFNSVDGEASATALLAFDTLKMLDVTLDKEIATCLYAAISTDTGNFAYSNTTAEAFDVMSKLMATGLQLNEINRMLFMERSPAQVGLLQRALATMTFHHGGEITSMTLTMRDFEECGALPEHADSIVNYGGAIRGVRMNIMGRETAHGIKMSLRSVRPYSVSGIAQAFGGGGHGQAAGCTVQGDLQEATAQVVEKMCEYLDSLEK